MKYSRFRRSIAWLLAVVLAFALAFGARVRRPLPDVVETRNLEVPQGAGLREIARRAEAASGVPAWLFVIMAELSGNAARMRAGTYAIEPGMTPLGLLDKLLRGEVITASLTIVEGWTFAQMRAAVRASADLSQETSRLSDATLMEKLGASGVSPEGRFYPDTYKFAKGSSDLALFRRAFETMRKTLDAAWAERTQDLPLASPEEALILASIIEKETGRPEDRRKIAAVFNNRLRLGMLLQTDPAVIYGLGDRFDGNLRKRDLAADTPYNTYTRPGLPPTPIALPGKAAIEAALNPESMDALYFVARGDGSSEFSSSLDAHNRAVDKYQRR